MEVYRLPLRSLQRSIVWSNDWAISENSTNVCPYNLTFQLVRVVLCVVGLLVVTATAYESFRIFTNDRIDEKGDSLAVRCLYCFSALNNGRKLLSTKRRSDDLTCIHGIRFLSTTWVMMGHCWIMGVYFFNYTRQLLLKVSIVRIRCQSCR